MKRFGFFLSILGLFISSNVLAMDQEISSTVAQVNREQVEHKPIDLAPARGVEYQNFIEQGAKLFKMNSEAFSSGEFAMMHPQTLPQERFELFTPSLESFSLAASGVDLGSFSFAASGVGLGDFSGAAPPLDLSLLPSVLEPPTLPKPIVREGIVLPKVDLGHLGISGFFEKRGISLGEFDFYIRPLEWKKFDIQPSLPEFVLNSSLSTLFETRDLPVLESPMPSLLDRLFPEKKLYQIEIPDLTDEEIILLFKALTSQDRFYLTSDEESIIKLEKLLQDARARRVILGASQGSEDHISKALEAAVGSLGNLRKLKILIAADDFLEHHLSQPADERGETVFSKALLEATSFGRLEALAVLFGNRRIWEHLGSIPDVQYQSVVIKALMVAVALNHEEIIPLFYELRPVFDHLVAYSLRGDADAQLTSKAFIRIGLLMALSERAEEKIGRLLHEGVIRTLQEDPDLINRAMEKAIEDRNPYLARKLLSDLKTFLPPTQIKEAIQVPEIWEALDNKEQQTLLTIAQSVDSRLTEEGLIQQHKQTRAYEHTIVGHPSVVEDMEAFAFERHAEYRALLTQGLDPREREARKKALEQEFLKLLSTTTAPWLHAQTEFAYERRMFGQGVRGLVVELDVLPEHQRSGLLHPHLGEQTAYKEKVRGSRSVHNIGVTSLVAQMAPLATITSTETSQLKDIAGDVATGKYPFINCSWGPCSELGNTDGSFSIFSSHEELNSLLGRSDLVLIKSAGNERASLSYPESTEDITGKVFAKLLNRLKPEQVTNLILAVNLRPTNMVSDSSNTPGGRDMIYRNTISAQGSETFWLDETGHHYRSIQDGGTSSAAPIVTGAALLLQSYKPAFSPVLVKACLLHSAHREFPIYSEDRIIKSGIYETTRSATWEQENLPQEQYSFSKYGMGILNVKAAFEYADLLEEHLARREGTAPMTFEEFESLRERLPVRVSRSSHSRTAAESAFQEI